MYNILVCDDEKDIVSALTIYLTTGGYQVFPAYDGKEALRVLRHDPEYFFDMAPYAMALGVGKEFSAAFKKKRLGACSWLTTGMDGHMTAMEWNQLLREAVAALDERQQKLPYEKLLGK